MALKRYHPTLVFLFFIGVLVLTMLKNHPAIALVSFTFALLLRFRVAGVKKTLRSLLFFIPMIAVIALFNFFFNSNGITELFTIGHRTFMLEPMLFGLVSGLILVSVMMWFFSYSDLMDNGRFLAMLGKRLPVISMMISMIFRYIPDTIEHGREIDMSQKALMGADDGSRKAKIQRAIRLTSVLMAWSMENAIETADSMKAKGYQAGLRKPYARVRWTSRDVLPLICLLLMISLVVACIILGAAAFLFYPDWYIPSRALKGGLLYYLIGAFSLLSAFPLILDLIDFVRDKMTQARQNAGKYIDPFVMAMLPDGIHHDE